MLFVSDLFMISLTTQMNELYITTAWFMLSEEDRKKQPLAGDLFRVMTDVKGIVEPMFKGV